MRVVGGVGRCIDLNSECTKPGHFGFCSLVNGVHIFINIFVRLFTCMYAYAFKCELDMQN